MDEHGQRKIIIQEQDCDILDLVKYKSNRWDFRNYGISHLVEKKEQNERKLAEIIFPNTRKLKSC